MRTPCFCLALVLCAATALAQPTIWSRPVSPTGTRLNDLWGSGPSDVIAVGNQGNIVRFNGISWNSVSSPTGNNLFGVTGSSGGVFAAGDLGTLLQFNGLTWSGIPGVSGDRLNAVWAAGPTSAFAVGVNGTVLGFDGTTWRQLQQATGNNLNDVWGSSPVDVWAVGDTGTIIHFDGATWRAVQSNTGNTLRGIWGSSAQNIFAVGDLGTIIRFDGATWSPVTSNTGNPLNDIWGDAISNFFAVGEFGTILRFDGVRWVADSGPTGEALLGVWGSGSRVFVVGNTGLILEGTRPVATVTPVATGIATGSPGATLTPIVNPTRTATAIPARTLSPNIGTSGRPAPVAPPTAAVSTPTAAFTPTPSAITTEVATAVPTSSGGSPIGILGSVSDFTGSPVIGVLVLSSTLGSTTTNKEGVYNFRGVSPNKFYKLTFQREDKEFAPAAIRAKAGSVPRVIASDRSLATSDCSSFHLSDQHVAVDAVAKSLRDLELNAAAMLGNAATKKAGAPAAQLRRAALKHERSARESFARAIQESSRIPVVVFSCPGSSGCQPIVTGDYKGITGKMARSVNAAARLIRHLLPGKKGQAADLQKAARINLKKAVTLLKALSDTCPASPGLREHGSRLQAQEETAF